MVFVGNPGSIRKTLLAFVGGGCRSMPGRVAAATNTLLNNQNAGLVQTFRDKRE
jgi:hypothetical protein